MAFFALISVFLALIPAADTENRTFGSTPFLKDIVVGRCEYYSREKNPSLKSKNCTDIWRKFLEAVAFKDACKLTLESYDPFLDAIEEGYISHKVNFKNSCTC